MEEELLLAQVISRIKQSVDLCLTNNLEAATLILIYSGIDCMANLARPENREEVTSADFIAWASKYIGLVSREEIYGEELYAARCGLLHTHGAETKKTKSGKLRTIGYVVGGHPHIRYNPRVSENLVLLDILYFKNDFFDALDKFCADLLKACQTSKMIKDRTQKLLQSFPL